MTPNTEYVLHRKQRALLVRIREDDAEIAMVKLWRKKAWSKSTYMVPVTALSEANCLAKTNGA